MGRRRGEGAADDLEVLDPSTGEVVAGASATAASGGLGAGRTRRRAGGARSGAGRRLRRVSSCLLALSLLAAGGAGYLGFTIGTLRAIDQTWAEAMALDRARASADVALRTALGDTGGAGESEALVRPGLARIGGEASRALARYERELRGRWIADDRIDHVRDLMVEALVFRRRQLSPDRLRLGDSPLQRAELALQEQRDRFDLDAAKAVEPQLQAARTVLQGLPPFADVDTGTILFAAADRRLVRIDVDASRVSARVLPFEAQLLVAAGPHVIAIGDGMAAAYAVDDATGEVPARWDVAGVVEAVGAATGDDPVLWMRDPSGMVLGIGRYGDVGAAVPMPRLASDDRLLADTAAGLLVRRAGALELVDRGTGAVVRTFGERGSRFAGASRDYVAFAPPERSSPTLVRLGMGSGDTPRAPVLPEGATDLVQAPDQPVVAVPVDEFGMQGVEVLEIVTESSFAMGLSRGSPPADGPQSVTWSPQGDQLFWLSSDGHVVFADRAGQSDGTLLRTSVQGLTRVVAVPARR